jgi:hypothetical protein
MAAACGSRATLDAERAAAIQQSVRAFAATVSRDITQEGPAAWRKHFADTDAFFMAVDGHLEYADSAAATAGIQNVTRTIKQIELRWGDDLRVDPLAPGLASLGTSWHEVMVGVDGGRVEASGYFTGVAEQREGRWQFRHAHWSLRH